MDEIYEMTEAQETEATEVYEEPQVAEPTYVEPTYQAPTYQAPAPQAPYYAPQQYNNVPETTEDEGGLDGKSVLVGVAVTTVIGGAAIGIKKGIDFFKKKKAEKEEFKKWQDERKAAEETIAKAKAEGKVVDVDAKDIKPADTEEVKQEEPQAAEPEAKSESKDNKKK